MTTKPIRPRRRTAQSSKPKPLSGGAVVSFVFGLIGSLGTAIIVFVALTQGMVGRMGLPGMGLVLAFVAGPIVWGLSLAGLICGSVALTRIMDGQVRGRGLARTGVLLTSLSLLAGMIFLAVALMKI